MSIRQTKNQMIFAPVGMMGQMILRFRQHKKKHGRCPRRIYVTAKQYNRYKDAVGGITFRNPAFGGKLYFRGAEVIIKS